MPEQESAAEVPQQVLPGLHIAWSEHYTPAWNMAPEQYVAHDIVAWGRSRRLARITSESGRVKAYLGVQHSDPSRWGGAGEPQARFFLSLFLDGRTLFLRTYPTQAEALGALHDAWIRLAPALA